MKNPSQFQKNNAKQTAWEHWFILSFIFFFGIFFICTLEGSKEVKELPYFLAVSIINLAICLYKGKTTKY
jgi:uncharacterized membrane protein YcaP (DUF421 family)